MLDESAYMVIIAGNYQNKTITGLQGVVNYLKTAHPPSTGCAWTNGGLPGGKKGERGCKLTFYVLIAIISLIHLVEADGRRLSR